MSIMRAMQWVLLTGVIFATIPAIAVELPVHTPFGDKGKSEEKEAYTADGPSAEVAQEEIVKGFDGALNRFVQAQVLLRQAFDIADEAGAKQSDAAAMGLEECGSQECLEVKIGMSERNQAEIDKALAEGGELDEEGKKLYGEALPLYARGTIDMGKLVPKVSKWSNAAQKEIKEAGVMGARKVRKQLNVGLYIARNTGPLAKAFSDATKSVVTYGKAKDLDTSAANDVEF